MSKVLYSLKKFICPTPKGVGPGEHADVISHILKHNFTEKEQNEILFLIVSDLIQYREEQIVRKTEELLELKLRTQNLIDSYIPKP